MEKMEYRGWKNCYRLFNDVVDLIVTTDIGPRVIRFGFVDEVNEFKEYGEMVGKTGGDEWRIYGGHRLVHAPEHMVRTYFPDNSPVRLEYDAGTVRLVQPAESTTGIQKEIDIRLSPDEAQVEVLHRLRNTNLWTVELAPWAVSVMASGGKTVIPLPPRASHKENLLPMGALVLWAYTDMADPRWEWGHKYVMLGQDTSMKNPQKAGMSVTDGWVAYTRNGHLFVKEFDYVKGASYPDFGCSVEAYTDAHMLEMETLGPLARLAPGAMVEHVERWFLFRDVPVPKDEAGVDNNVLPLVRLIKGQDATGGTLTG